MTQATCKASPKKRATVTQLEKLFNKYPIIGVLNMANLPAPQLQGMRAKLRDNVEIYMAKRRFIKIALNNIKNKKNIGQLVEHMRGQPALLFTTSNPFTLYKNIKKNKSPAPAKAGQIAPNDITVKAGATPFSPGPVIAELSQFGIKAGVENGKVAIKEDKVVCKEGQEINAALAGLLARLSIKPMEIGLDLVAVYEAGTIYNKKVLDIDEKQFMSQLTNAITSAFNLAVDTGMLTKETTEFLIQKAFREAKYLAIEQNIVSKEVIEDLLAKANRQARGVAQEAKLETN